MLADLELKQLVELLQFESSRLSRHRISRLLNASNSVYMYCLCSDLSFDEILQKQVKCPLPRKEMIERYTRCNEGCGSCIEALVSEAEMLELMPVANLEDSE